MEFKEFYRCNFRELRRIFLCMKLLIKVANKNINLIGNMKYQLWYFKIYKNLKIRKNIKSA
jgi:hypothetical protein